MLHHARRFSFYLTQLHRIGCLAFAITVGLYFFNVEGQPYEQPVPALEKLVRLRCPFFR